MKRKRIVSFVLSLIMCLLMTPLAVEAENTIALEFSSSANGKNEVLLGEYITYTVKVTGNEEGFIGTFYFDASSNLTYVSATLMGEEFEAEKVSDGENEGAYAIFFTGELFEGITDNLCTITFKVTNDGETKVDLIPYQLTNGENIVTATVTDATQTVRVETLTSPIITTAELPEGIMNYEYSFKLQADREEFISFMHVSGDLPDGLTLSENGTISGTPLEYGEFTIEVKANLLDKLYSDPITLTLNILEKPRKIEISEDSRYTIDDEGYLIGVKDRTTLKSLLDSFKDITYIKVHNAKNDEITSENAIIGTGYTVSLIHGEEIVHKITVVVKGDTSGDGKIGTLDHQRVRAHFLRTYTLEGAYLLAADTNGDGKVGTLDHQRVRAHFLGNFNLFA